MTSEEINRALWDERAPAHAASPDYHVDRFAEDPTWISDVVRFDRPLLGSVDGLRGVHLQCHIGTDTVSLARLGARMTGLDFSPASLAEARRLAESAGVDVEFVQARVYDAPDVLDRGAFRSRLHRHRGDQLAARHRPLGRRRRRPPTTRREAVHARGPPRAVGARREPPAACAIEYPYFEQREPQVWDEPGTYVTTDVELANSMSHEWNHGLGEIVTAVLDHGMQLTTLVEHTSVPWPAIPNQMELLDGGEYRLLDRPERLPHTYTLSAIRR